MSSGITRIDDLMSVGEQSSELSYCLRVGEIRQIGSVTLDRCHHNRCVSYFT